MSVAHRCPRHSLQLDLPPLNLVLSGTGPCVDTFYIDADVFRDDFAIRSLCQMFLATPFP